MDEKKSGQVGEQPENVLEGKIPDTEKVVYFTEEEVDDKGDCGFIALATDRNTVANELLELSEIEDFRSQLWQEIYEAFETHRIERTAEFELHFNAFQEPNLVEEIYARRRKALEEYCSSKEIYELYVNAYRGKLWLGYKSALLFAQAKKITVYIWRKDTTNTISILDSEVSRNQNEVFHLLLTRGYTHYNLLVETKAPAKIKDKDLENQAIPNLDPTNEAHRNFAKKIAELKDEDIEAMLMEPAEKFESGKGLSHLKRSFKAGHEAKAREERTQDLFNEISSELSVLFPDLKKPFFNEELKLVIADAKKMAHIASEEKNKSSEVSKDKKEKPLHVTPKAEITFNGKDFYTVIDKLEKPILEAIKSYGYSSIQKTSDTRKLVKDDGTCIEIAQNGEMNTLVSLASDPDKVAKECAKKFVAMIMVYYEIAQEMGKDKAFSSKSLDMSIEDISGETNSLVKMYVKQELAKPPLNGIKDKFTYDGEALFPDSVKADTKAQGLTLLKPPKEMRDNVDHGLKENNDTSNSIPSDNQHTIQQRSGRKR